MSTSYSCDCYLHKDHTPLLPGSRGMYHRRCYSMTTLASCYYYMVAYIYVTALLSFTPAGCPMFFPTRTLNSLLGLLAILDTSIFYPYNCYLHTYHIPPLLGHWGRIIDVLYDNVGDLLLLHSGPTQYIYVSLLYSPLPAGCLMFFPTRTLTAALTTKCPVFGLSSEPK